MKAIGVLAVLVVSMLAACTPAALTPEEIVPAFIAASQADTRTMHMEWQGTVATASSEIPEFDPNLGSSAVTAAFDFNGPDYAGTMNSGIRASGGGSISYARVGGLAFINYNDSGWQRSDSFGRPVSPEMDPMHDLTAADVVYEGLDTLDGHEVHRLRVADPLAALAGGLFDQGGLLGAQLELNGPSDYVIYVDGRGIPAGAKLAMDLKMNVDIPEMSASEITYQINFTYTFSLWGEPLTISPPQVTGGGFEDVPPMPGIK